MPLPYGIEDRLLAIVLENTFEIALPAPLEEIAEYLGVQNSNITYHPSLAEGYVDWSGPEVRINLAYSRSDGRRRFTLAHELGHIILRRPETADLVRRFVPADSASQERLCDRIASSLLVPYGYAKTLNDADPNLELILAAADRARVSLPMLINRLADVGSDYMLLKWLRTPKDRWLLGERCNTPQSLRSMAALGASSGVELDKAPYGICRMPFVDIEGKQPQVLREVEGLRRAEMYTALARRANLRVADMSAPQTKPGA